MAAEWLPTQKQMTSCLRILRKQLKTKESKKEMNHRINEITKHWDYGSNPQKTKSNGTDKVKLGVKTILQRLDSNAFRKELTDMISTHDVNNDIHKTASYLLRIVRNINFWLLKGINNNGDKVFFNGIDSNDTDIVLYKHQLLTEFNLSAQIGQSWDVITERLYGCQLVVYFKKNKYFESWIKTIGRDALAVAFDVTRPYRVSYVPAVLVDIDSADIGLMMVLSGSKIIDNRKHIGFGYCNIIKKKPKGSCIINGHSMVHILQENKHDIHVELYAVNNAVIDCCDIQVSLEPHSLKKSGIDNRKVVTLCPVQHNDHSNIYSNNHPNGNDNHLNDDMQISYAMTSIAMETNQTISDGNNFGVPYMNMMENKQQEPLPPMIDDRNQINARMPFSGPNYMMHPDINNDPFGQLSQCLMPEPYLPAIPDDGYNNFNFDILDTQSVYGNDSHYGPFHTVTNCVRDGRDNPLGTRPSSTNTLNIW